jgi:glycosyltransferase involved in cell wall biosynthesis
VRIIYLSQSGHLGGAERSLLDFIASVGTDQPDWRLDLVLPAQGPMRRHAENLGVQTHLVELPQAVASLGDSALGGGGGNPVRLSELILRSARAVPDIARYVFRLRAVLRELTPNLIHANGLKMDILGVWARPSGVPFIWHIHDYISSRRMMASLLRTHACGCAAAIANSESVTRDLESVFGERLSIRSIPNAVDLNYFSAVGPALDLDQHAGMAPAPPGTIKIGLIATMARWKGHEVFLRAVSMLPKELPVRAYVVGGAIYQTVGSQVPIQELRILAQRMGLADKVAFTGFVEDPAAAMRSLDIVVHASTQPEPFGLVIAEAMAVGKPVIASAAGGAGELISDGLDGLTHPPGDASMLANCISDLVKSPEKRYRLGQEARLRAEKQFVRSRLARDLVPLYQQCVERIGLLKPAVEGV